MPENLSRQRELEIRERFNRFPFPTYLGISIDGLEYGLARLRLPFRREITQGKDYIHGGAITALCDSAVAFALATMIGEGENMLTIELKINFTAPADTDIIAEAKIIHKGDYTAVGEVEVTDENGKLVAKSLVTYFLKNKEGGGNR
jgi:uncharacterized protein (TIGR00369 family)